MTSNDKSPIHTLNIKQPLHLYSISNQRNLTYYVGQDRNLSRHLDRKQTFYTALFIYMREGSERAHH